MALFDKAKDSLSKLKMTPEAKEQARRAQEEKIRNEVRLNLEKSRKKAKTAIFYARNSIASDYAGYPLEQIPEARKYSIRKACYLLELIDDTEKILNDLHVSELLTEAELDWVSGMGGITQYDKNMKNINSKRTEKLYAKMLRVRDNLDTAIQQDLSVVQEYCPDECVQRVMDGEDAVAIMREMEAVQAGRASSAIQYLHTSEDIELGTVGGLGEMSYL